MILFFVLIFSLPASAITEKEFERICRSDSVQELQAVIANEKNFANIRFREMNTPLIMASKKSGNPECLRVLLENGADPNIKNEDGKTALMLALDDDLPEVVINALLDAGADAKVKDRKGRDIFHYAGKARSLRGTETMKRLEAAAK